MVIVIVVILLLSLIGGLIAYMTMKKEDKEDVTYVKPQVIKFSKSEEKSIAERGEYNNENEALNLKIEDMSIEETGKTTTISLTN